MGILRLRGRFFKAVFLFIFAFFYASRVLAYSYRPACQWIRLYGRVEVPEDFDIKKPILLTVTYLFEGQTFPAILLTNYPLKKRDFVFVLSGFSEKIEGVVFLPFEFSFDHSVRFQYFVTTSDRKHRSKVQTVEYYPERIKKDGVVLCQTALQLGSIVMK